jgi:hypothetical protein
MSWEAILEVGTEVSKVIRFLGVGVSGSSFVL